MREEKFHRRLRLTEGLALVVRHGSATEMVNTFELANPYGRTSWNEFVCGVGCISALCLGYANGYSEGWYKLTSRGLKKKKVSC